MANLQSTSVESFESLAFRRGSFKHVLDRLRPMAATMEIEWFLERYVEGYLFQDLRRMAEIELRDGEEYGAVGYPMVLTALAGVELLGALTSSVAFDPFAGKARFREFWSDYLYPDASDRRQLADAVYTLVRHGLAHSAMTKPTIWVTKGAPILHLRRPRADVAFVIDATSIATDLENAYWQRVKPDADLQDRMAMRLAEMRTKYTKEIEALSATLGAVQVLSIVVVPAGGVNSPAPGAVYSSNASQLPAKDT
jgi:hypothetical protein